MKAEGEKKVFRVSGMSCAACAARVENGVARIEGVQSVQVSLLAGRMQVIYEREQTNATVITAAVCKLGYGAEEISAHEKEARQDTGEQRLKQRMIGSCLLLLPMMAMHHWSPGREYGWIELLLLVPILYVNRVLFKRGLGALLQKAPNMDSLVSIGALAAVADGVCDLFVQHRGELYFESAAMILTLITLGKWLEARATGKTGAAVEKMAAMLPATATVQRGEESVRVPAGAVQRGDTVIVAPGESIPVDGIIIQGESSANESALTGESIPTDKTEGDMVYAATTNGHGLLQIRCTKTRDESAMADIIRLVGEAAATKAPISRLADRVAGYFVPMVMAIALLTTLVWIAVGGNVAFAISCGIAVLVISCPCALGLATPVGIMVGVGKGAEGGILYRSGGAMEQARNITCLALDKTGTLTQGAPTVCDVIPENEVSREELLRLAALAEKGSRHPLAAAIAQVCPQVAETPDECRYEAGRGIVAKHQGNIIVAGNAKHLQGHGVECNAPLLNTLSDAGKTPIALACNGKFMGIIAVQDALRPDAEEALRTLRQMGIRLCMMTGDLARTAAAVATKLGIGEYRAECLPADKETWIQQLQAEGEIVGMVGDGINDAPALMRAHVGISLASGTDIARESADIILVHNRWVDVVQAICLSRAVIRNIRQNLFWAFAYNVLAIPLAAGLFYPLCGWLLHPAVAAGAMGLSSLCVVSNALRLRRFRFFPNKQKDMNTITLTVTGMMCPHCEQHVTKALLALDGVAACSASHKDSCVTITLSTPPADLATIKATITQAGYEVK